MPFPARRAAASPAPHSSGDTPQRPVVAATAPPPEQSPPSAASGRILLAPALCMAVPAVRIEFRLAKSCLEKIKQTVAFLISDYTL